MIISPNLATSKRVGEACSSPGVPIPGGGRGHQGCRAEARTLTHVRSSSRPGSLHPPLSEPWVMPPAPTPGRPGHLLSAFLPSSWALGHPSEASLTAQTRWGSSPAQMPLMCGIALTAWSTLSSPSRLSRRLSSTQHFPPAPCALQLLCLGDPLPGVLHVDHPCLPWPLQVAP